MKLLFVWLINTIIVLPFKVIRLVIKIIYQVIKNIYFNNLNLDYINNLDGYQFEAFTKTLLEKMALKTFVFQKAVMIMVLISLQKKMIIHMQFNVNDIINPLALKLFKKQLLAVFTINVIYRLFLLIALFLKQL